MIVIVTTGGTIAMKRDEQAGGAVPTLGSQDFLTFLPTDIADVRVEEYCNLPSAQFTLKTIWGLRGRVDELVRSLAVEGVVITHGTDVLEEVACLLDWTVDTDKPIVLTGAMRSASEASYDGIANLIAAVRVAANQVAAGLGTLVVLNDEIHAARHATKTHSRSVQTFQSPPWGPLGRVDGEQVSIVQRVEREHIPCARLEENVHLIKLSVGADDSLLRYLIERGAKGAVIEVFGSGRIPPWWLPTIKEAVEGGMVVVATSRCPTGRLYDGYGFTGSYKDLVAAGALFAGDLNGQKARLRLMVTLGATDDPAEVRQWFETG